MANRRRKRLGASRAAPAVEKPELTRRVLRSIIVVYLFCALLYATQIPFGAAPDETAHLRYVEHLAQIHRLPVFPMTHPGSDYEFHQPPLYYVLALPSYLIQHGAAREEGLGVRFFTLLLGLALVYLTYLLARRMVPDRPWTALAAAAFVAFLPMHLHLAASVSNDVLTEVWFALVLVLLVGHLRAAAEYRAGAGPVPSGRTALWVGALIGLGMLTKSSALVLFPVSWAAFAFAARGPEGYRWRRLARDLALCTGLALAVCGWWLVRNQLLYGDPLTQHAFLRAFTDRPSPAGMMHFLGYSRSLYVAYVATWTFDSIFGVFGPTRTGFIFYPTWVYLAASVFALLALIGFFLYLKRAKLAVWQRQAWWVVALLGALVLASFVGFNLSFFQAQARYLFPVLPAAALATALGLEGEAPGRYGHWVSLSVAGLLLLLAVVGLSVWVVPPFLSS